jgi:hypothetical protein
LTDKKYETKEMIMIEKNPSELFLLLCEYLFIIKGNVVIHSSGKHVQNLVKHLKKIVEEDLFELVLNVQTVVMDYLASQRKEEKFEQYEILHEKLEELKKIVLK